ncbi:MAG: hypothetical protein PVH54_10535 [Gammaproteobacteria bacterium]
MFPADYAFIKARIESVAKKNRISTIVQAQALPVAAAGIMGMAWVMPWEMAGSLALAEGSSAVPGSRGRAPGFPVHNHVTAICLVGTAKGRGLIYVVSTVAIFRAGVNEAGS